jgi:hypothetical protein
MSASSRVDGQATERRPAAERLIDWVNQPRRLRDRERQQEHGLQA